MSLPPMEIYCFEEQFNMAVETILRQNGVNDVDKQQDSPVKLEDGTTLALKTPRIEVKYLNGGFATNEHYQVINGVRWLDMAAGSVYLKVVTKRRESNPTHAKLRGIGRYVMQQVQTISGIMKYHFIQKMIESNSTVTFEADKIHDVSALTFNVWLSIRPEWFPTS